jgi:hypothetical protein
MNMVIEILSAWRQNSSFAEVSRIIVMNYGADLLACRN